MDKFHNVAPICTLHGDEEFMGLAVKVTTILHDIYPTDAKELGYYVDNDTFSFRGQNSEKTRSLINKTKELFRGLMRKAGNKLRHEFSLFDNLVRDVIRPEFEAPWFDMPERKFENGPLLVHMPTMIIGNVLNRTEFELEAEHEEAMDLKIDLSKLEPLPIDL